jgi:putative aldouronate transport system substrate-binding protein
MMLINLINTDIKLYNTMCYGVEGTHYVLKDGHVAYPEGVTGDKSPYNPDTAWEFGNSFNAYPRVGVDPAAFKAQQEFDKAALPEPALGFSFDPTPVKTELAQCTTTLEELLVPLVAGSIDVDVNYPKLLENLKTAGSDKIIAEKQKQLDEFLATRK